MLSNVGTAQSLGGHQQHAGYIQRYIAVANHHRAFRVQVELAVDEVRVTVVPGYEFRGGNGCPADPRQESRGAGP